MNRDRMAPMRMTRIVVLIAAAALLASCGQPVPGPQGTAGPAGPPGLKGEAGPAGISSTFRLVKAPCTDASECTVNCRDDEVVVTAYCGRKRAPATFLSDLAVSCGVTPDTGDGPLVAICGK